MENLKKSNELLEAIIDGTAFDKETGLIWEHWVNAIIKQAELNNIELRDGECSDENSGLHLQNVSQQRELFVSFARFAHNYGKGSYGTSYEEMFSEWLQKRNK